MTKKSNIPLIIGNWKMNLDQEQIKTFFHQLLLRFPQGKAPAFAIAPQYVHIPLVLHLSQEMAFPLRLGAQNCGIATQGAYTGEVSPHALSDLGADFVIVGHSERREHMAESAAIIRKKMTALWENGLVAVLCVGENAKEREKNKQFDVVKSQLEDIFTKGQKVELPKHSYPLIIAYEPIWAIGTGTNATAQQAQEMHAFIRKTIQALLPKLQRVPILYGGSVTPHNIVELLHMEDVDGALIGGASMNANSWGEILQKVREIQ